MRLGLGSWGNAPSTKQPARIRLRARSGWSRTRGFAVNALLVGVKKKEGQIWRALVAGEVHDPARGVSDCDSVHYYRPKNLPVQ